MFAIFLLCGYFVYREFKPKPPPPPPAPPPILQEPLPIISEQEQAKVLRAAHDQDPGVRWEAVMFLEKIKHPKALPLLFEKLHRDPDVQLRMRTAHLLGERQGREVSQNLVKALKDAEPQVRVAVLQALERLGDYGVASVVTESLNDQEEAVRLQALRTLNSLQDKKAAEIAAEQARQEELRRQAEGERRRK